MSASPGALGGIGGLAHLRQILAGLNVLVTAEQIALPAAQIAFDEHGGLKNAAFQALTELIGARTVHLARALKHRLRDVAASADARSTIGSTRPELDR